MFEGVTVSWGGESYTIPANEQMVLIEKIETALNGGGRGNALDVLLNKGATHLELSRAYAAALQHAGAPVTQAEIYYKIQMDIAELSKKQIAQDIHEKIMGLIAIISPPVYSKIVGADTGKKSTTAATG